MSSNKILKFSNTSKPQNIEFIELIETVEVVSDSGHKFWHLQWLHLIGVLFCINSLNSEWFLMYSNICLIKND